MLVGTITEEKNNIGRINRLKEQLVSNRRISIGSTMIEASFKLNDTKYAHIFYSTFANPGKPTNEVCLKRGIITLSETT